MEKEGHKGTSINFHLLSCGMVLRQVPVPAAGIIGKLIHTQGLRVALPLAKLPVDELRRCLQDS